MPLFPSPLNDTLTGTGDPDTLSGLAGNDVIYGLAGGDLVSGDDGDDALYGGDGADTIYGGQGSDRIEGGGAQDALFGDAGNDSIELGVLAQVGSGMAAGGTGDDTIRVYDAYGAVAYGEGSPFDSVPVIADVGFDTIEIVWIPTFLADDVTIEFNAARATSAFGMSLDFYDFERLTAVLGLGDDTVGGSSEADDLWVDAGANRVDARGGADTVRYQIGEANTLEGGAGHDRLIALSNFENPIYFVVDTVTGTVDDGKMSLLTGFEAYDVIGSTLDDTISTGMANDEIYGHGGQDTIDGMAGNDRVYGGSGNDDIGGGEGDDSVFGDAGADTIAGEGGNDVLAGSAGGDLIFGDAGRDTLNGGFGYDTLYGGAGADSFFHLGVAGHGTDWIKDYAAAELDLLTSGRATADRSRYQVNFATTPGQGDDDVAEAFVIYRPTGQILWAVVDGAAQEHMYLRIAGQVYDLLA